MGAGSKATNLTNLVDASICLTISQTNCNSTKLPIMQVAPSDPSLSSIIAKNSKIVRFQRATLINFTFLSD